MTSYYTHQQQGITSGSTLLMSMPWALFTIAQHVSIVSVCNRKLRDEMLKWGVSLTRNLR
jgi:uncharacterized membrane protein YhaH (DUF805 family)